MIRLLLEVGQGDDTRRVVVEAECNWRPLYGWQWSLRGKFTGRWYGFRDDDEMYDLLGSMPPSHYVVMRCN